MKNDTLKKWEEVQNMNISTLDKLNSIEKIFKIANLINIDLEQIQLYEAIFVLHTVQKAIIEAEAQILTDRKNNI